MGRWLKRSRGRTVLLLLLKSILAIDMAGGGPGLSPSCLAKRSRQRQRQSQTLATQTKRSEKIWIESND